MRHTQTKPILLHIGDNRHLARVLAFVNKSEEIHTLWHIINTNAVARLGMTDHGPVHFQIVAENSLKLLRLLSEAGVKMSVTKHYGLSRHHAEIIVVLASLLHDTGMTINREGHEELSLIIAKPILEKVLSFLPERERLTVTSEILHAIISHRSYGEPVTMEAGIMRVADALDMTKGRSRLPYDKSLINIHSVSAKAVDTIEITKGARTPVEIGIYMNHTAGLFQVDELLKKKVLGSGVEKHLEIKVYVVKNGKKQLFKDFFQKG